MSERLLMTRREFLRAAAGPVALSLLLKELPVIARTEPSQGTHPEAEISGKYNGGRFAISGIPEKIDPKIVLKAEGRDKYGNEFKNTIGQGTEMIFAERGVLLVGPDFPNEEFEKAKGHTEYFSPINQVLLTALGGEAVNVAEGRFAWFTGAQVQAEVDGIGINLESDPGHNWFLAVRGLFSDGQQDRDRNRTMILKEYKPGHAQVMLHPPGAYISESQLMQVAKDSHTDARNCGAEGCSRLSMVLIDLNTRATSVVHQEQQGAAWKATDSNWR